MTAPRRLGHLAECLTCETPIEPGELAYTEPRVGAWHTDCDPPRNLSFYLRERDRGPRRPRRRDFGLDED